MQFKGLYRFGLEVNMFWEKMYNTCQCYCSWAPCKSQETKGEDCIKKLRESDGFRLPLTIARPRRRIWILMNYYSTQITNLIEELRRLPGIGSKSAQRLAFHIINMPEEHVHHLAQTLVTAREKIRYCKYCCTLTDSEVCPICASTKRDHSRKSI